MLTPSCWAKILHIQIIYEMTPPHRHSRAFDPSCFYPLLEGETTVPRQITQLMGCRARPLDMTASMQTG